MSMDRREFTALFTGALASLALPEALRAGPCPARRQETFFTWSRPTDHVHVATGGGGNTVFYLNEGIALQSDAKNFGLGTTLRREIEGVAGPVRHFVNTHHHGDHSGGNLAFSDVETIAHMNAAPRIREGAQRNLERAGEVLDRLEESIASGEAPAAMAGDLAVAREAFAAASPDDFVPKTLHEGSHDLGEGRSNRVQLRWVSRGHTDGDTFLYFAADDLLHGGDLLFHGRHPYVDVGAGATPEGWVRCLNVMEAYCGADTVVVPGHGEVGGIEIVRGQRGYFEELQRIVERAMAEGRTKDELPGLAPPALRELPAADPHLGRNLGFVWDEMI